MSHLKLKPDSLGVVPITQILKAELPHDEGGITDWLQFRTIVTPSIAYLQR